MKKSFHTVSHQGGCRYMEDRSFLIRHFGGKINCILGGVFDGHGGAYVARLASAKIPELVLKNLKDGMKEDDAFKKAYEDVCLPDECLYVGCCALTFLIKGNDLYVANSGDCRLIMVTKKRIFQVTKDHRVENPAEYDRILGSGGSIDGDYVRRGDRGLMTTRTLGDGYFKSIGIISDPEVFHRKISTSQATYIIAATDGVWDEMTNGAVAEAARKSKNAQTAAESILSGFLSFGSILELDNMAVIVARISPGNKK